MSNDEKNNSSKDNVLITFDIDGTLLIGLNKGKCHQESFKKALFDTFGIDMELPHYGPSTDLGISKQIILHTTSNSPDIKNTSNSKAIIEDTPLNISKSPNTKSTTSSKTQANVSQCITENSCEQNMIDKDLLRKFMRRTEDHYIELFDGAMEVMPGVKDALEAISKMDNVTVGTCTGNFARIAMLKIEKAGFLPFFSKRIGGFGDNFESRTDILREAHRVAEEVTGKHFTRYIHVGDSPQDVQAANDVENTTSILVETSAHSFGDDEFPKADFTFANLRDHLDEFLEIVKTGSLPKKVTTTNTNKTDDKSRKAVDNYI